MRNLHEMKARYNFKTLVVMLVTTALLLVSYPYRQVAAAKVEPNNQEAFGNPTKSKEKSKVFERKSLSGETVSRLQLNPVENEGQSSFLFEGMLPETKEPVLGVGNISLSTKGLKVTIKDSFSGTEAGYLFERMESGKQAKVTLSLNGARYKVKVNLENIRSISDELQSAVKDGNKDEIQRLNKRMQDAITSKQTYLDFLRASARTPLNAVMSTMVSTVATLSADEGKQAPELIVLSSALKTLAPSAWRNVALGNNPADEPFAKPLVKKVSHSGKRTNPAAGQTLCCSVCSYLPYISVVGCGVLTYHCDVSWGVNPEVCLAILAGCLVGGYFLTTSCYDYCVECGSVS